jgi:hypothetical protein
MLSKAAQAERRENRGRLILSWGPGLDGGPRVDLPALSEADPKPRPVVIEAERGKRWTGGGSPAYESDLPSPPRVRAAAKGIGRRELRHQLRMDPDSSTRAVKRARLRGGRRARTALGEAAALGYPVVSILDLSTRRHQLTLAR